MRYTKPLCDLQFWLDSTEELLRQLQDLCLARQSAVLTTPNLSFLYQMGRNIEVEDLVKKSEYQICDSKYVGAIHRLAYRRTILVLPGSDLIKLVLSLCNEKGFTVAVIGGLDSEKVIERSLRAKYESIDLVYVNSSKIDLENQKQISTISDNLHRVHPQIVFVALGFPKQERLTRALVKSNLNSIFINIGEGLNYLTETKRRAPRIFRVLALEWLWRLGSEPKRLMRRYLLECLPEFARQILNAYRFRYM